MVIVFDLDDTLYPEITFVLSGFKAVAEDLSIHMSMAPAQIFQELENEFKIKRSQVFDRFLSKYGLLTKERVVHCVGVYRNHQPAISLFPDALDCLERLNKYPMYVVTDGNQRVQRNKFKALQLGTQIKKCICTYAFGLKYQKPSPYCFLKICEWEGVDPSQVVYIADNPYKDFVGIKPLGFQTVRLLQGPYKNAIIPADFNAKISVEALGKIDENLIFNLKS